MPTADIYAGLPPDMRQNVQETLAAVPATLAGTPRFVIATPTNSEGGGFVNGNPHDVSGCVYEIIGESVDQNGVASSRRTVMTNAQLRRTSPIAAASSTAPQPRPVSRPPLPPPRAGGAAALPTVAVHYEIPGWGEHRVQYRDVVESTGALVLIGDATEEGFYTPPMTVAEGVPEAWLSVFVPSLQARFSCLPTFPPFDYDGKRFLVLAAQRADSVG